MGIYSDWASRYFESGLTPIPCEGKRPKILDWSAYSTKKISQELLDNWESHYANANIGLVMGQASGVVAFDLDYLFDREWNEKSKLSKEDFDVIKAKVEAEQDQIKKEIIAMLPPTPCVKIGKDGKYCYFYRPRGNFQTLRIDRNGIRLFDVLWDGTQTILPPSIHPDTNKPYRWINGDLTKHIQELPFLDWETVINIKNKYELLNTNSSAPQITGRNDLLKKYAYQLFKRGLKPEACVAHLLEIDIEKNSPPLFSDKTEFKRTHKYPEQSALIFAQNNYKSFKINLKNDPPPRPEGRTTNHEQIGFYYRYRIPQENGSVKVVDSPQYKLMADHIFAKKNMAFDDSVSLKFDGKMWQWMSQIAFHNFITEQNEECIKPGHLDSFAKMIKAKSLITKLATKETDGLINVNNGIVDIKKGELLPHSHEYLFKYVSPVDFDKKAQCPTWLTFLHDTFDGNRDLIDLTQRMFGYLLIGGRPFLHRAFVLYGTGRNGKSTFVDILRDVLGSESYSTVSMSKLDKEFSIVSIDGKLANIVEETPNDQINAEAFKNMVGGGEVQAAHKGYDEYKFRCKARFVFACNDMPVFKDKSVGLEERLVFIPFRRFLEEEARDLGLYEKLLGELSGILNWAVMGAKIIEKEKALPKNAASTEMKEIYRMETDPLYAWFCEEIKVSAQPKKQVAVKELYTKYRNDCEDSGNFPFSRDKFMKRFRTILEMKCRESGVYYEKNLRDKKGSDRVFVCFDFVSGSSDSTEF